MINKDISKEIKILFEKYNIGNKKYDEVKFKEITLNVLKYSTTEKKAAKMITNFFEELLMFDFETQKEFKKDVKQLLDTDNDNEEAVDYNRSKNYLDVYFKKIFYSNTKINIKTLLKKEENIKTKEFMSLLLNHIYIMDGYLNGIEIICRSYLNFEEAEKFKETIKNELEGGF